jgi:hypothetical protein
MSGDKLRVQEEMSTLQDSLKELQQLDLLKSKKGERPEEYEQQQSAGDEYYAGRKREYNLDIFGFNFTELDAPIKYFIGFLLIAGVFMAVLYALKKINEFNKKDPKKKDKKQKQK